MKLTQEVLRPSCAVLRFGREYIGYMTLEHRITDDPTQLGGPSKEGPEVPGYQWIRSDAGYPRRMGSSVCEKRCGHDVLILATAT